MSRLYRGSALLTDRFGAPVAEIVSSDGDLLPAGASLRITVKDATDGDPQHFNLLVESGAETLHVYENLYMPSWWRRALHWLRNLFVRRRP